MEPIHNPIHRLLEGCSSSAIQLLAAERHRCQAGWVKSPWMLALAVVVTLPTFQSACGQVASPSDFRCADLPPVLKFMDGREITSPAQWPDRRKELGELWQDTYIGHFPESIPDLVSAEVAASTQSPLGTEIQVTLTFAAAKPWSFEIRVLHAPGDAATERPLILTQPRHYQIAWAKAAVRRGYAVCLYPGVDYNHHEKMFPGYEQVWRKAKEAYPNATWNSSLAIQAWIASRTLDYLLSPESPFKIAKDQIGIIGHSRYGKQSLYAAAFDERITAVVARSSGSPTAAGYRFTGRHTFMETVRDFPAEWALTTLKHYFGCENRLPVEANGLIAMIAPRACLLHTAYNDGSDPTFAVERTYRSAKKAYALLGAEERLGLAYRSGNHDPITDEHIKLNLDWFDWAFGRGAAQRTDFPEELLHAFDWEAWKSKLRPSDLRPPAHDAPLRDRVEWMLGTPPSELDQPDLGLRDPEQPGVTVWSRDRWKPEGIVRQRVSFGRNVQGNLMYSQAAATKAEPLPVVIWLHPFNYSHGSNEGYGVEGTTCYYRIAQAGYAVLGFDQCGFGDRLLEGTAFYENCPNWSRMGRMVFDVRTAIDFLVEPDRGVADGAMPALDAKKIYLLGYSLGGMVALHAAALDDRIAGLASFSAFTPMRTDTDASPTGGIRRLWDWHALLPKLGLFHQRESDIPYDYEELIASTAPKPILIVSPLKDWHATVPDVRACVARAQKHHAEVVFETPDDTNRFQSEQQRRFLEWLDSSVLAD